jgi:hypothetical protein
MPWVNCHNLSVPSRPPSIGSPFRARSRQGFSPFEALVDAIPPLQGGVLPDFGLRCGAKHGDDGGSEIHQLGQEGSQ